MSSWTERKITRELAERGPAEPPEGLLDRIKSEIPPDVGARLPAAAVREARTAQVVAMPRRQRLLLAASIVLMVTGGLFAALLVMRQTPSLEQAVQEKAESTTAQAPAAPAPPAAASGASDASDMAVDAETQTRAQAPQRIAEPLAQAAPVEPSARERAAAAEGDEPAQQRFEDRVDVTAPSPALEERRISTQATEDMEVPEAAAAPAPPPPPAPSMERKSGVMGGVVGGVARDEAANEAAPQKTLALSTGSSIEVVRRSLREGRLPPREAVRVDEIVDAFSSGDPPPGRGDFALRAEGAASDFSQESRTYLLRFNVRAREAAPGQIIAEDARVQVDFQPAAVTRWRLLGSESRTRAGRIEAGQSMNLLYEVQLAPGAKGKIASLHLRYRAGDGARQEVRDLQASDLVLDWDDAPARFRLATLVAEFAETLQGAPNATDLQEILRRARKLGGEMAGPAAEFTRLVEQAARIQER